MQNISPNTLFTGQQYIYFPVCNSTNTEASELLIKNRATEGCVVLAAAQMAGRGQRGNSWEAEPDRNLTFSLVLKPNFLPAQQQFFLNMAVSLGVLELLQSCGAGPAAVKWPNDVYAGDKKVAGILIENSVSGTRLQHSVIGIGLNVNQLAFQHERAASLAQLTGRQYDLGRLLERLLEFLEKRYLELRNGQFDRLRYAYLQHLYRYQEFHWYEVDGERRYGQIVGVDEHGRLAVQFHAGLEYFSFKEIKYCI